MVKLVGIKYNRRNNINKSLEEINTDTITEDTVFLCKIDVSSMPRTKAHEFIDSIKRELVNTLAPAKILVVDSRIDITKLSQTDLITYLENNSKEKTE